MPKDEGARLLEWTSTPSFPIGSKLIGPAPPPTRWERIKHWLKGTEPPKEVEWTVVWKSTEVECDSPATPALQQIPDVK